VRGCPNTKPPYCHCISCGETGCVLRDGFCLPCLAKDDCDLCKGRGEVAIGPDDAEPCPCQEVTT